MFSHLCLKDTKFMLGPGETKIGLKVWKAEDPETTWFPVGQLIVAKYKNMPILLDIKKGDPID